mgnify:CR=1 FL=1
MSTEAGWCYNAPMEILPPLRHDIEILPCRHGGEEVLVVRDSLGFARTGLALNAAAARFFPFFDGTRPLEELQLALTRHRGGLLVPPDEIRALVEEFDRLGLLQTERYHRARHRIVAAFHREPERNPALAGGAYPAEPVALAAEIDRILAAQTHSIIGFRPACYYGCQIVRPYPAVDEDPELPMAMEKLFSALGAEPVDYPPKVRCCGGMMVATFPEVAQQLSDELTGWAREREASCIVAVCPLCQATLDLMNVDGRRGSPDPLPVIYFTQLIGLALGCSPKEVGLQHGLAAMAVEASPLPIGKGGS